MYYEITIYNRGDVFYETSTAKIDEESLQIILDLLKTRFPDTHPLFGELERWFAVDDGYPDDENDFDYFDFDYAGGIATLINDKVKELGYEYAIKWKEWDSSTNDETESVKEVFNKVGESFNFCCYFLSEGWNVKNEFDIWNTDKDKPALSFSTDFHLN